MNEQQVELAIDDLMAELTVVLLGSDIEKIKTVTAPNKELLFAIRQKGIRAILAALEAGKEGEPVGENLLLTIFRGTGAYNGDGETIHTVAQKLADEIATENLRKNVEQVGNGVDRKPILSRRTISLLNRDFQFAARIESIAKLEQRDADQAQLSKVLKAHEDEVQKAREQVAGEFSATIHGMLDGMGYNRESFRASDWNALEILEAKYLKPASTPEADKQEDLK